MTDAALDGVLVADFTRVLAGPYATMLLADLGAQVVKVERPDGGDDTRAWGPPFTADGEATYFLAVNRNKTSIALDLRSEEGREAARALTARADVLVENFRAGTMERLGLGYESLRRDNPGLVYCSITGFGSGAGAAVPGYDLLVQALGGLMSITGPGAGQPTKVGVALVDVITGLHATVGMLAALRHRERTGQGQHVEVNLLSSLLSALVNQASAYLGAGVVPGILGNRHPSISPYEVFSTADRPLVLAVGTDRQFASLAAVVARPDLAADARFATNADRVRNRDELVGILAGELRHRGADEWFDLLVQASVPAGPINDIAEAFAFAERLGLRPSVDLGRPDEAARVRQVANPIHLSETPARYDKASPRLGEDSSTTGASSTGVPRQPMELGTVPPPPEMRPADKDQGSSSSRAEPV